MKPLSQKEIAEAEKVRQNLNDTAITEKEVIDKMVKLVDQANVASVLMAQLCKAMDLVPSETTHQKFVEAFSKLQKTSLQYQQDLQEMFVSTQTVKERKKRVVKTKKGIVLENEIIPEKTDEFQNGNYV